MRKGGNNKVRDWGIVQGQEQSCPWWLQRNCSGPGTLHTHTYSNLYNNLTLSLQTRKTVQMLKGTVLLFFFWLNAEAWVPAKSRSKGKGFGSVSRGWGWVWTLSENFSWNPLASEVELIPTLYCSLERWQYIWINASENMPGISSLNGKARKTVQGHLVYFLQFKDKGSEVS